MTLPLILNFYLLYFPLFLYLDREIGLYSEMHKIKKLKQKCRELQIYSMLE